MRRTKVELANAYINGQKFQYINGQKFQVLNLVLGGSYDANRENKQKR